MAKSKCLACVYMLFYYLFNCLHALTAKSSHQISLMSIRKKTVREVPSHYVLNGDSNDMISRDLLPKKYMCIV